MFKPLPTIDDNNNTSEFLKKNTENISSVLQT